MARKIRSLYGRIKKGLLVNLKDGKEESKEQKA